MRSRKQTIAIILSKFKNRFGTQKRGAQSFASRTDESDTETNYRKGYMNTDGRIVAWPVDGPDGHPWHNENATNTGEKTDSAAHKAGWMPFAQSATTFRINITDKLTRSKLISVRDLVQARGANRHISVSLEQPTQSMIDDHSHYIQGKHTDVLALLDKHIASFPVTDMDYVVAKLKQRRETKAQAKKRSMVMAF